MSDQPQDDWKDLSEAWTSQPNSSEAQEIIDAADRKRRRMGHWIMADMVAWLGVTGFITWEIMQNNTFEAWFFYTTLLIIMTVASAYVLWIRATNWGQSGLDAKAVLQLNYNRCVGGIKIANICLWMLIPAFAMNYVYAYMLGKLEEKLMLLIVIHSIFIGAMFVGVHIYKNKKRQEMDRISETLKIQ